jgi:hypothetical protein
VTPRKPKEVTVSGALSDGARLVARPATGGALKQGGRHANSGPLRSELRAEMRGSVKKWWVIVNRDFNKYDDGDKLKAVDLAARYGLGVQTQALTPAAIDEQIGALGSVIMESLAAHGFSKEAAENFMQNVVKETKRRLEE